jgi:hypothetical protein
VGTITKLKEIAGIAGNGFNAMELAPMAVFSN